MVLSKIGVKLFEQFSSNFSDLLEFEKQNRINYLGSSYN
jgi:hypothetical protein